MLMSLRHGNMNVNLEKRRSAPTFPMIKIHVETISTLILTMAEILLLASSMIVTYKTSFEIIKSRTKCTNTHLAVISIADLVDS